MIGGGGYTNTLFECKISRSNLYNMNLFKHITSIFLMNRFLLYIHVTVTLFGKRALFLDKTPASLLN